MGMSKRGIIISPTPSTTKYAGGESIDPTYLRHCLLYWDKIDCPNDHLIKVTLNKNLKDIELLQKEGIFIRTEGFFFVKKSPHYNNILSVHTDYPTEFWALAQLYAFKKHSQSGNLFSIGQFNNNLIFSDFDPAEAFFFVEAGPFDKDQTSNILGLRQEQIIFAKGELKNGPVMELELYQAIPVPLKDVPIEDILKFKDNRRDELLRFRHAMDTFYQKVIDSKDIPRAKTSAIEEIELSLLDITKVMIESRWKIIRANTDISIDLTASPFGIIKNVKNVIDLKMKLSIKPDAFMPREIPDKLKDFAYLYHAKEELRR
jgi:hypothetical protein